MKFTASRWIAGTPDSLTVIRLLAAITIVAFFGGAVRAGWTRSSTDFPNYYTAARLVRLGQPLRRFYDWTWFARQQNAAGFETFVGSYTPQTPLTMLPLVAVSAMPPQRAKQAWIAANVVFVTIIVWLLSRMTRFKPAEVWLLVFVGFFAWYTNFLYGQYYVLLLLLLTATCYLLRRGRSAAGGFMAGVAFGLKLYGGPFLLYFLVRRDWRAVFGMLLAMSLAGALALMLFGLTDTQYYLSRILPRSLEGGSVDMYSAGNPTLGTMLRRFFMREPALNPHPLVHAPWLFFFLRTLLTGAIIVLIALGLRGSDESYAPRALGWFISALLLLSTSLSSYSFLLVALPVVLALDESRPVESALILVLYAMLAFPIGAESLFPKAWLALLLFAVLGRDYWRSLRARDVMLGAAAIVVVAFVDANRHMSDYEEEPGQRFERVAVEQGALFESSPAISADGLFYQFMAPGRYVVRWLHDSRTETLSFVGQALNPVSSSTDGSIRFELVTHGVSTMMQLDPTSRRASPLPSAVPKEPPDSAPSPDGRWVAFVAGNGGPDRIWLRNVGTNEVRRLTGGACNSVAPAWELDSRHLVFASDCGRAVGLPTLYRAPIPGSGQP